MIPELVGDGMVVAGDAAALCLAAGIWLEGVNFALGSGMAAGQAAAEALRRGDTTAAGLAGYRQRLQSGFVLGDHRKLRDAPHLVLSERVQGRYPAMICNIVEQMFTVDNPAPKPGLRRIATAEVKRAGVRLRDLARDAWVGAKSFG
jgi:electron transfer flavoprotein-quinone oxidoreductase